LNELVRAPLFPRPSEAGSDGPLDQAAKDGRTAIEHETATAAAPNAAPPPPPAASSK
jgi:hypothetical protein